MSKLLYLLSLPIRTVGFSILVVLVTIIYCLVGFVNIIIDFEEYDFKESFEEFYFTCVDLKDMCFKIKRD